MTLKDISPWLVLLAAIVSPYVTEWARSRFGRRGQRAEEANKSHDQLQEDLAAERERSQNLEVLLAASRASEDNYRESMRTLVKENVELVRKNGALESDLRDVLKGGLMKKE